MLTKDLQKYIKLDNDTLYYKSGFRWKECAISEILWTYLRVEEVKAKMCCGQANFDMCMLVLWTKEKQKITIQLPGKDETLQVIERLTELNPAIETGFNKEKEALYS